MNVAQKVAWYNLAVVTASLVVVLALIPVLGPGAQGGFGLLGLLGFSPILFRRRAGQNRWDERDAVIHLRSLVVTWVVLWLVFVAACMAVPAIYGYRGSIPVVVVQSSVWVATCLVFLVMSITTLIQQGSGGGADAV